MTIPTMAMAGESGASVVPVAVGWTVVGRVVMVVVVVVVTAVVTVAVAVVVGRVVTVVCGMSVTRMNSFFVMESAPSPFVTFSMTV